MATSELPLVIYTVLLQLAVGAFVVLEAARFIGARAPQNHEADDAANQVVYSIGVVALVGLAASFFHVKVLFHAPFALVNIGTSWMTREIWLTVIFVVLLVLYALVLLRKVKSQAVRGVFAVAISLVGLALVFCMSNAYLMPAMPAWDSLATPFTFYAVTFLLGPVYTGAALAFACGRVKKKTPESAPSLDSLLGRALKLSAVVAVVALAVETTALPLHLSELVAKGLPSAIMSVSLLAGEFGVLFGASLALTVIGVGAFGVGVYENALHRDQTTRAVAGIYASAVLLLVAEVLGRYVFYATAVSIGF